MQFDLKTTRFLGRTCRILSQNENGPCPLLALANALILQNKISFHADQRIVSLAELIQVIANIYIESTCKETSHKGTSEAASHHNQLDEVLRVLPTLARGLDLNVLFTGVSNFEYTQELAVFDALGITVFHGWLVDQQDVQTASVVNSLSYNHLMFKLVEYRSLLERIQPSSPTADVSVPVSAAGNPSDRFSESDNPMLAAAAAAAPASTAAPTSASSATQAPALTAAETQLLQEGAVIDLFLQQSASQLTYSGLLSLHQAVRERQLGVFFRNNHFCTIFKNQGSLYLLVTDLGYANEPRVVWELLDEIDGDTEYVDENFLKPSWGATAPASLPVAATVIHAPRVVAPSQVIHNPSSSMPQQQQYPQHQQQYPQHQQQPMSAKMPQQYDVAAPVPQPPLPVVQVPVQDPWMPWQEPMPPLPDSSSSSSSSSSKPVAREGAGAAAMTPAQQAQVATAAALAAVDSTADEDLILALRLQDEEEEEERKRLQRLQAQQSQPHHHHHHPPVEPSRRQFNGLPGGVGRETVAPPTHSRAMPPGTSSLEDQERALEFYRKQKEQNAQRGGSVPRPIRGDDRDAKQDSGSSCTVM